MKKLTLIGFVLMTFSCTKKIDSQAPTIYFNGDIITMEGKEPKYAEAVVEENGKVAFVGTQKDALKKFGSAKQIDLQGKTMLPAFIDGHGHFYGVGFAAMCANILPPPDGPGKDIEGIVSQLNSWKNTEEGKYIINKFGWIIGNGYDDSQLDGKEHPIATDLDKVSTDIPVLILHQSGHLGVINSKAIEILGYNKQTPNPSGGILRRNKDNSPNGVLEENAMYAVLLPIFAKTDADVAAKCIEKAQYEYARKGYLTVQDGRTTLEQLTIFQAAAENKDFYLDIVAYPDITLGTECMSSKYYNRDYSYNNRFRIGGVKLTLDGSPQGKTAWLSKCYHVNPEGQTGCYKGYPIMDDENATMYVKKAFENKWQLLCHTNGDAAIDQYIRAVKAVEANYGYNDHRTVLIHGQTLRKDQIPKLVNLGILPSLFPMHTFYWGDWHVESVLGEERASYISPCRDVVDAGLTITSHHDAPVTFPNSMRVIDATVNRITRSGKILGPDQRLTVYEALKTHTEWAAIQYFEENSKGTITEGKLADFVILDKNPLKINPMNIYQIEILESVKEGKTVFKVKK